MDIKNIYKKTLAMELIKKGHNFQFSKRNPKNRKYQIYAFEATEQLIRDMVEVNNNEDA